MRFNIVTPVLNGEKFINETILSVISQAGPFSIRYHVQDGGSTDATIKLLTAWQSCLANYFPISCSGIEFSFASQADRGLYDAVNRGFAACGDSDVMAWINADDRYEPGAFATVAEILSGHPGIDWITARPAVINEAGGMLDISPIVPFPRKAIAAGIFDGRFGVYFIQQESTFWRPRLWEKANGLNADFRLAGDFDLWRRFAKQTDLVIVDTILGCFRKRVGQLSEDLRPYQEEIDKHMSPDEKKVRARALALYKRAGFTYPVLPRWFSPSWLLQNWPMCAFPSFGHKTFKMEYWRIRVTNRFGDRLPD